MNRGVILYESLRETTQNATNEMKNLVDIEI